MHAQTHMRDIGQQWLHTRDQYQQHVWDANHGTRLSSPQRAITLARHAIKSLAILLRSVPQLVACLDLYCSAVLTCTPPIRSIRRVHQLSSTVPFWTGFFYRHPINKCCTVFTACYADHPLLACLHTQLEALPFLTCRRSCRQTQTSQLPSGRFVRLDQRGERDHSQCSQQSLLNPIYTATATPVVELQHRLLTFACLATCL